MESDPTDSITASFLSVYAEGAVHMNLWFHNGFITMRDFLRTVVPYLREIKSPLHSEEIGRVWHQLLILPQPVDSERYADLLPRRSSLMRCESVPTDRKLLYEAIFNSVLPAPEMLRVQLLDQTNAMPCIPVSTLWVTTWKTECCFSSDNYFKRVRVIKEASLTRLFIAHTNQAADVGRYNITWVPHHHSQARVVRMLDDDRCSVTRSDKYLRCADSPSREIRALVYNVRYTVNQRFCRTFNMLLSVERPNLVILLDTGIVGIRGKALASSLGFRCCFTHDANGSAGGFIAMWLPTELSLVTLPFFRNGLHIGIWPVERKMEDATASHPTELLLLK